MKGNHALTQQELEFRTWLTEQKDHIRKNYTRKIPIVTPALDTVQNMDIRIAIDIGQRAEEGVPVKLELTDDQDNPVDIFAELRDTEPVEQPLLLENGGGRIFIADGGDFKFLFTWTASDGKERTFPEEVSIPVPPVCPRCEQRVPELSDYICDDCRFGSAATS